MGFILNLTSSLWTICELLIALGIAVILAFTVFVVIPIVIRDLVFVEEIEVAEQQDSGEQE